MLKKYSILISLGLIFLLTAGCNKSTPPPTEPPPDEIPKDTVSISVEDVTHRSVSINIKSTDNNIGWEVILYRTVNGTDAPISHYPASINDTTIIDDNNGGGLQLDTEYKYYAALIDTAGNLREKTLPIAAKTLAATSHNYTWQEYTFGDVGIQSSLLYDVWGADENNVWAVGTVFINDTAYGVFKWNGSQWLPDKKRGGLNAVFGFSNIDVWIAGGEVSHYDGNKWNPISGYLNDTTGKYIVLDRVLHENTPYTSIWGTSSNNLYLGNGKGTVVYWDGSKASIVDVNQGSSIHEMNGYKNFIVAVGTNFNPPSLTIFYDGLNWEPYPYVDNSFSINSAAVINQNNIYWAGDGIHMTHRENFSLSFNSGYYIWDIYYNRNTGELIACGVYDGIYINNGIDWFNLREQASTDGTSYKGIYSTDNKLFLVGNNNHQAKIVIGRKNNK